MRAEKSEGRERHPASRPPVSIETVSSETEYSATPDSGKVLSEQSDSAPLSETDWDALRAAGFRVDPARGVILTGDGLVAVHYATPSDEEAGEARLSYPLARLVDPKAGPLSRGVGLLGDGRVAYDLFSVTDATGAGRTIGSARTVDYYAAGDDRPHFFEVLGEGGEIPVAGIEDQLRRWPRYRRIPSVFPSNFEGVIEKAETVLRRQGLKRAEELAAADPAPEKSAAEPTGAAGYVTKADYEALIADRAEEVVEALGLDASRGDGECLYGCGEAKMTYRPDSRRVFCYCAPKGDSVADFVRKCESLPDFDAAKVRIAEILDRRDLIKAPRAAFVKADAASLLNPPAALRDDDLVAAYLGHRLGVAPADVPMPSTAAVGISALGYYEPGPTKGSKPVLVATTPAVVFGMTGPDGRVHAQRIHVAPGGAGKADLGVDARGVRREPKKAAPVARGAPSTAGLAAIWGDAASAPKIVVGEGVETMAAAALAFRAEIEAGEIAVAAAMTAGGVESFRPWPATRAIVVAADRDEAVKSGGTRAFRTGETSARKCAFRNWDSVAVSIALPGTPDTNTDWLDVLRADGVEAVRAGILAAAAYEPTESEIEGATVSAEDMEKFERAARDYPLPVLSGTRLHYCLDPRGDVCFGKKVKRGKGEDAEWVDVPVSSLFGVSNLLRFVDKDNAYGLRLTVEGMKGERREIDFKRGDLVRATSNELKGILYDAGFVPYEDGDAVALKALKESRPQNEISVVGKPGWHPLAGADLEVFACPSGEIVGGGEGLAFELSANARVGANVARGGTIEGWRAAVSTAATVEGCPHWSLGIVAGFAGPIVQLTGLDTCGINFSGRTSGGKSTAQRLAVSAWSLAKLGERDSLFKTANATANGVEGPADRANGTVLAIDELKLMSGRDLGKLIFALASNVGKTRMNANAEIRKSNAWNTFVLLSNEQTLEEKITSDGGEWYGGMAVRMPDVGLADINRSVPDEVLSRINAIDRHFGHAGPAFVREIVARGLHLRSGEIRERINLTADRMAGEGADAAVRRSAIPFAILEVSGRMAREFGILPDVVDVEGVVAWAWAQFSDSTDAEVLDPNVQIVENLRAWIAQNWDVEVTFAWRDDNSTKARKNSAYYDNENIYIPATTIVEAAGKVFTERDIGKALAARELIVKHNAGKNWYRYIPGGIGNIKCYVIPRFEFRPELNAQEKEQKKSEREVQRNNSPM